MTESPGCASCGFPIPAHFPGEITACPLCHAANQVAQAPLVSVPSAAVVGAVGLAAVVIVVIAVGRSRR